MDRYLLAPHTAACIADDTACSHPQPQPRRRHAENARVSSGRGGRRGGSARFATYYKIQTWEERSLTWKDIQRSFDTEEAAWEQAPEGARLMEVSMAGRRPITR